jgi:hypothetical protein
VSKIYSQLENAQLENRSSDYAAGTIGRTWWNTTVGQQKVDDGSAIRAVLRNDQKAIIGNSGTAADNIRFHRGAAGVMQLVLGSDTTAEGTLATVLNSFSAKLEAYNFASRPAVGNAGRLIWVPDRLSVQVDTGLAWLPVGSGGGAGALQWIEGANSPIAAVEVDQQVYQYQAAAAQELFTNIRVPSGYVAGSQIKMKVLFLSADSSGTAGLKTVSTLIRPTTDLITSTTNQRTSTNSALTLSGGTVEIPQAIVLDLTDSSGQINGVAVSAGDLVKVKLYRDTDTATSDIRALPYNAEVTFQ